MFSKTSCDCTFTRHDLLRVHIYVLAGKCAQRNALGLLVENLTFERTLSFRLKVSIEL